MTKPIKRLLRPRSNHIIAGVCSGIADYFSIDATIVRLIYIGITLLSLGLGLVAYLVMWIMIPQAPIYKPEVIDHEADKKDSQ